MHASPTPSPKHNYVPLRPIINPSVTKGKIYEIGSYDPRDSTVMFSVFVTDRTLEFEAENPRMHSCVVDFRRFRLIVYARLLPVPSSRSGTFFRLPAGKERWNNEPISHQTYRAPGIPLSYLPLVRDLSASVLRPRILGYIFRDFGPEIAVECEKKLSELSYIGDLPITEDAEEFKDYIKRVFF
jgi:hypothetical protein